MKYLLGVGLVFVLQVAITLVTAVIPSNGSFLGLGIFLLAVMAVPLTAIGNWAYIKAHPERTTAQLVARCFAIGLIVPAIQVGIVILWKLTGI